VTGGVGFGVEVAGSTAGEAVWQLVEGGVCENAGGGCVRGREEEGKVREVGGAGWREVRGWRMGGGRGSG